MGGESSRGRHQLPLCATAFVRMQAEIRASVYGPGLYGNGRKKERKKRRERSAKQWILEGALFFHFSPSSPFLSLSLSRFFSRSFFPFRKTTATSWQTGRYVPVRSALTSPFLSNLICRERRCYRRASPTFHLASNYRR